MDGVLPEALAHAEVPRPVLKVVSTLKAAGHQAYLVGGCVRDMLRGVAPKDFDVATCARPEAVQRLFSKVIPTGIEHGTVTVLSSGQHVEVTTFRLEGEYVDGRRPSTVAFHTEVEADLSRRDFTINAMAFDPDAHELVDPFDGQGDLGRRLIRCVGQATERFGEDGLRALRAVRFAAVLGFELAPETQAAIPRVLEVYRKVAAERVREELQKLLLSTRPALGLALFRSSGLLRVTFPTFEAELDGLAWERTLKTVQASSPVLSERFAALFLEASTPRTLLERLKPPSRLLDEVDVLCREHAALSLLVAPTDGDLRRMASRVGPERARAVLALAQARREAVGPKEELPVVQAASERLLQLLEVQPPLSSRELALDGGAIMRALGVGPSPRVGEATRFLLARVLEDPSLNQPEILTLLLAEWSKVGSA